MAKVYIDVSHMTAAPGVPASHKGPALIKVMQEATARIVDRSPQFTTKAKSENGFSIEYTLASVTGTNPVRVTFKGLVATLPDKRLITQSLSGGGNATPPSTVADVAEAVLEDLTARKVLPVLAALVAQK